MKLSGFLFTLLLFVCCGGNASAATPAQIEFFESRIRPILAQECYECHSEETKDKGGLLLDTRAGWEAGGDSGEPIIVPGKPDQSLLILSIAHEIEDLKMPKAGAKLEASVLANFRKWIADGAVDPRDVPPTNEELAADTDWTAIRERREGWWSFQPIVSPGVPEIDGANHPVDRFVREKLEVEGLSASPQADARTLHRRINYTLIGLPPTVEESDAFLEKWNRDPDRAVETLVDQLMGDQRFGEKWARHWMDWLRYADSHGSEGDPTIPYAWQYRDYLIRALNADVPYDQLVQEHVAGDLLESPRINEALQLNESAIGPAHLRMVFHGFAPTDALDERVRFTDDQINVVTKAFMGLTVSCARCHDHKFDAISQADYYALFGIFTPSLPATVAVDAPGVLERNLDELAKLKPKIRKAVGKVWLDSIQEGHIDWSKGESVRNQPDNVVSLLVPSGDLASLWKKAQDRYRVSKAKLEVARTGDGLRRRWNLADSDEVETWTRMGEGLSEAKPSSAGAFSIGAEDAVIEQVLPAGVYTHGHSSRHRGFLASGPVDLDGEYDLYLKVAGENAMSRFAVQNYPRRGTVFPVSSLDDGKWTWVAYNKLDYWDGDSIHIELSTAGETAILVKGGQQSWFGIREALLIQKGAPGPAGVDQENFGPLFEKGELPESGKEARRFFSSVLEVVASRWGRGEELSDAEALFLDDVIQAGLLPNQPEDMPERVASLVERYRELESEVPSPTRAPGLVERAGQDHPLYVRGDHKQPGKIIPRRFLEAIDETPYDPAGSGRLEFARDLLREDNPFTSRMIVNRIWHHLFGVGLVASADNFGRLGEQPSHPELLDFLANRFREDQAWSIKTLVRDLVLSETWQQASLPSELALERDPDNRLLSHYSLRRLEAEAIRDAVHFVSGRLDERAYGDTVSGNSPRRAIYLRAKRNTLDPFMTTFDFPVPASTVGRRDATNVPAQSLTLLNDPYLIQQAGFWADRISGSVPKDSQDDAVIRRFFLTALNREPTDREMTQSRDFLYAIDSEYGTVREQLSELREALSGLESQMEAIEAPIRERLLSERAGAESPSPAIDLRPVAHWDFASGLEDLVAGLNGELVGSARVENGALVLDGQGFMETRPIGRDLNEKTLEVRVQLDDLTQRAGGVMTLQDLRGGFFDSIVFAERKPREWLMGSNNHHRTLPLGAAGEADADRGVVHLVATFEEDGTIQFYRNGEAWGEPTRKADLHPFKAGETQIVFGIRHGTRVDERRMLKGRIYQASLYDRALTHGEVTAAYAQDRSFLSEEEVLLEMSEAQKRERDRISEEMSRLETDLVSLLGEKSDASLERQRWQDFAHAMFNLKEFIYLR